MTDLKCPFCPEVRPSRSRLQTHVDGAHYTTAGSNERHDAVTNARTVETVEVTAPELSEVPDREALTEQLGFMNKKLRAAGGEMAQMRAALDSVDERMKKLDAQLISPPVIRHATLNEVWDRLMAEGNITGAIVVMDMIRNTP